MHDVLCEDPAKNRVVRRKISDMLVQAERADMMPVDSRLEGTVEAAAGAVDVGGRQYCDG